MSVIYILQDGKHLNTDIYKIGKTSSIRDRLLGYSKNTVLHQTYKVEPNILDKMEKKIKYHFLKKFTIALGQEWFKGNIEEMKKEIQVLIDEGIDEEKEAENNICEFCSKEFSCKASLTNHQRTVKSCLILQGKQEETVECENCKKILAVRSYRQHKLKCDIMVKKVSEIIKKDDPSIEKEIKELRQLIDEQKSEIKERDLYIDKYKSDIIYLEKENEKLKSLNELLEKQNEKLEKQVENLQSMSTSVTMKLAENFLEKSLV